MNENNLFSKWMSKLCHKYVIAHSSRIDEIQFELAARWVSNNPSFF